VGETAFAVPSGALDFWRERLTLLGVAFRDRSPRFGEESLELDDPDGLRLALIAAPNTGPDGAWVDGPIPAGSAIYGIHSASIALRNLEPTADLLTQALGFQNVGREGDRLRLEAGVGGPGALVDLLLDPAAAPALSGAGTVHHIAWRAHDERDQAQLQRALLDRGLVTTPVVDRQYFKSIYFREPGGTLFELATDGPGFLIDEPAEQLGSHLRMPAPLEPHRAEIEAALPVVRWPGESVEVVR
jgi:glyoxalase family protein